MTTFWWLDQTWTKLSESSDSSLNYYLGMKITRSEEYIKLDQSGYVREILEKYSSHLLRGKEGKTVNTPMERDLKFRKSEVRTMSKDQQAYVAEFPYQNLVGVLLYLALNTRPDISYAVARFTERARH